MLSSSTEDHIKKTISVEDWHSIYDTLEKIFLDYSKFLGGLADLDKDYGDILQEFQDVELKNELLDTLIENNEDESELFYRTLLFRLSELFPTFNESLNLPYKKKVEVCRMMKNISVEFGKLRQNSTYKKGKG